MNKLLAITILASIAIFTLTVVSLRDADACGQQRCVPTFCGHDSECPYPCRCERGGAPTGTCG